MAKFEDLTGQKFGRLTVISIAERKKGYGVYWLCKCECGNETITSTGHLKSGHTKSCGCLQKERAKEYNQKHCQTYTRMYYIWISMKGRCYNNNNNAYKNYGKRGIKICDEWLNNFEKFYEWSINNGYTDELTIDRIDVNGNYTPENCRWVDRITQANNTTRNKFLTYNNETKTLAQWCNILNLNYHTIKRRLNKYHWSVEKALSTPIRK